MYYGLKAGISLKSEMLAVGDEICVNKNWGQIQF